MGKSTNAVTKTRSHQPHSSNPKNGVQKQHGANSTRSSVEPERGTPDPPLWKDMLHEFNPTATWYDRMSANDVFGRDAYCGKFDPTIGKEVDKESRKKHNRDWGTQMTRFMASSYGLKRALSEGWHAVRPVGIGGEAMVALWARTRPDGTEEFMAVREIFPKLYDASRFGGNQTPEEVKIHRRLSALGQNTESILKLKDYRRFLLQRKHRMYLEWAPHGNLRILVSRYQRWRRYLPEPFLWYLFHKLAKALVILQYGRIDAAEGGHILTEKSDDDLLPGGDKSSVCLNYESMSRMEMFEACKTRGIRTQNKATKDDLKRLLQAHETSLGQVKDAGMKIDEAARVRLELQTANWKEIVHRDISPNNIFFGEPENGKWSMYPMPKLADYGTAIETYDGDPRNPGDYNWRAHRVWIAPEQRQTDMKGDPPKSRINAQLNIYQLGLIMTYATGLDGICVEQAKHNILPHDTPYRMPLISLLHSCLFKHPNQRVTPLGLYRITGEGLENCYAAMNGDFDRYRLYFRGNEINDMETGFHLPREDPENLALSDEQFPVADTMNDESERIHPPAVDRFYPYESDGREFFKTDVGDFRKRYENKEATMKQADKVGFKDFDAYRYNRMTIASFESDYFDSSDSSGSEALERFKSKVEIRLADKHAVEYGYDEAPWEA